MSGPKRIGEILPIVLADLGIKAEPMTVRIWFDGACEPRNPGGVATCGWIIEANGKRIEEGYATVANGGPKATNNFAEWCALGLALRWLVDNPIPSWDLGDSGDIASVPIALEILGDSQLVIKQLLREWACKAPHLIHLRNRCLVHLQRIGIDWSAEWIPREQNEQADALSRRAYTEETGKAFPERARR